MATTETRQMFEQLLKKAGKKKGGKEQKLKKTDKESEIVENLERSLTKDDPLLESNTYNGEAEKNLKNLRNSGGIKGKENKDAERCQGELNYVAESRKQRGEIKQLDELCTPSSGNSLRKRKTTDDDPSATANQTNLVVLEKREDSYMRTEKDSLRTLYQASDTNLSKSTSAKRKNVTFNTVEEFKDFSGSDEMPKLESILKGHSSKFKYPEPFVRDTETRSSESGQRIKRVSDDVKQRYQPNRPVEITIQNVDSLSNVFQTIWEKHSETLVKEKIRLKLNDSFESILEEKSPLSPMSNLRIKRQKKRESVAGNSNIKLPEPKEPCLKRIEKAQGSKFSESSTRDESNTGQRSNNTETYQLEGSQFGPNVFESIWKGLSNKFFKPQRLQNVSSEPSFLTHKLSSATLEKIREHPSEFALANSFECIERILFEKEFGRVPSADDMIVLSDARSRRHFWQRFWRRNGVHIKFGPNNVVKRDENFIHSLLNDELDKDGPKKPPRAKKKKVKKKDEEEFKDETALYAGVKKPVKKQRTPKRNDTPVEEAPLVEDSPRPVPTPRKANAIVVKADVERVPDEEETAPKSVEDEEETVPKTIVKRKKKKIKKRATSAPRALPTATELTEQPTGETIVTEEQDVPDPQEEIAADTPHQENIAADGPSEDPDMIHDDGTILGIMIHYCDHIIVDPKFVAHPLVKISIIDGITGKFLQKSDSTRSVSSFYESDTVSCIVPLMTQPFDFRQNRSLLPRWEELLIFNESFARLTHNYSDPSAPKPILFFVIRDFITMAKANNKRGGNEKGWHNVSWAFLKLINSNGKPNAGRKMRLQLFYPPRSRFGSQDPNLDPVYDWWLNHPRQRYPGTLYVTVKDIVPPENLKSSGRSLSALQEEETALTFNQMNESLERANSESRLGDEEDDLAVMQQWSRLPGQTCKIPNAPLLRLWAGSEGAFMVRFSHKGSKLAAACRHETTYPILLFGIPGGEDIGVIAGHQQLVYDLQWSKNDKYLLSASADGTAQVWNMEHKEKPVHTLPHPCYVYTASFHPTAQHLIATGGYDSIVRVWNTASVTSQLTQELDGHKAIINSIIFDNTGLNMYSADGVGVIICWNSRSYEKAKKNIKTNWTVKSKIEDRDLAGICINNLRLHPHNNKIVIHCRDSTVRLLDARIHSIKKFTGLLNYRQLLRSAVTPCGSFIFSGSEDGSVYVWNVDTGDQVAIYNELGYTSAVHTVSYHPHDHLVAFCSYAPNQSILLYKFNSAVATMEAGFKPDDDGPIEETAPLINARVEAAKTAVNLERIKQRLDSVLTIPGEDFQQHPNFIRNNLRDSNEKADTPDRSGHDFLPPIPQGRDAHMVTSRRSPRSASPMGKHDASYPAMSTWGSTFDSPTQMNTLLAPSYLSPHASPEARIMAQQYIRNARQDQIGGWQPGVTSVGGSPYRNQGAPPDVSFLMDEDGKQKLNISSVPGAQSQSIVIVLFDYLANRSDELTVVRGDFIRVLYKDSANWWFGEKTSDKMQGYFPSNYVEEQAPTASINQSNTQTPVFGVPESTSEKKVYALKMPSGRLNFYSQSESEGDDERLSNASMSSRQRRREERLRETLEKPRGTPSPRSVTDAPTKTQDRIYPKSILQKTSPRTKLPVQTPSAESVNIKEVSFADDKKGDKKPKVKQQLLDSIQAAIDKTEPESAASGKSDSSETIKPKPRSATKNKPPQALEETPSTSDPKPKSQAPHTPSPRSTPTFGILKSVQALMNNQSFSQSVVGGPEVSTPKSSESPSAFRPAVHSTAVKKPRGPVENDEDPLSPSIPVGSVVRKARPLPKIRRPLDEESIPMVKMAKSKNTSLPMGVTNPAFDASP